MDNKNMFDPKKPDIFQMMFGVPSRVLVCSIVVREHREQLLRELSLQNRHPW